MKKLLFLAQLLFLAFVQVQAQYSTLNAHSHNDYEQKAPFFLAYDAHFGSVEADIWIVNNELFVSHNRSGITAERTLDALYVQPIVQKFKENGGKAWADRSGSFLLLIDLKNDFKPTLKLLIQKLEKYPEVFDPLVNKNAVRVVITGNRPGPSEMANYPDFISFDGNLGWKYNGEQRNRVALFSHDFARFSKWKGEGILPEADKKRLEQVVDSVHGINCKIRFWDAPDTPNAWKALMGLKVDYINTDHIEQLKNFLNK